MRSKDIVELSGVGLEELAAGGHVEEKVLDLEVRANRAGNGTLVDHLRAIEGQVGAQVVALQPRGQLHLGDGSDGREGLAAESHGVEGEEVVGLADLRRGMTLEGQAGIGL